MAATMTITMATITMTTITLIIITRPPPLKRTRSRTIQRTRRRRRRRTRRTTVTPTYSCCFRRSSGGPLLWSGSGVTKPCRSKKKGTTKTDTVGPSCCCQSLLLLWALVLLWSLLLLMVIVCYGLLADDGCLSIDRVSLWS